MPHISLAAEKLWTLWGIFPISNSLVTTWVVMGLIFTLSYLATRNLTIVPGKAQSIAEMLVGGLYDFFGTVTGKHIKQFFPLLATLFIFILTANWLGLLPGVGTIGFFENEQVETVASPQETLPTAEINQISETIKREDHEVDTVDEQVTTTVEGSPVGKEAEETHPKFTPLLRGPTADLNTTLALGIIALVAIQYFGFKTVGVHYSSRFLNFGSPIYFFLGILELVSEISKVISFAFRLFGNIFAGEVLLAVMAFLMPFVVPLPFLMMELFVGFIQALVFSMLTAVFLNVAVSHGEEHGEGVKVHG